MNIRLLLTCVTISFLYSFQISAQNAIKAPRGYSPLIGTTVSMMDDLKKRITESISDLNQEETDFLLDEDANRIGALIMHLAATEKYYQLFTFENRGFNAEEEKEWGTALSLGKAAREKYQGNPIQHYLDIWDEVRKESKKLLKDKDDKWFESNVEIANMNNHWAWYHVMEHQANHMGQIRLIQKRIK